MIIIVFINITTTYNNISLMFFDCSNYSELAITFGTFGTQCRETLTHIQ